MRLRSTQQSTTPGHAKPEDGVRRLFLTLAVFLIPVKYCCSEQTAPGGLPGDATRGRTFDMSMPEQYKNRLVPIFRI
jgi:hypothetical protein